MTFLVVTVMMTLVVPKVTSIFEDFGKVLPWYTRALMFVSTLFTDYWYLLIGLGRRAPRLRFKTLARLARGPQEGRTCSCSVRPSSALLHHQGGECALRPHAEHAPAQLACRC